MTSGRPARQRPRQNVSGPRAPAWLWEVPPWPSPRSGWRLPSWFRPETIAAKPPPARNPEPRRPGARATRKRPHFRRRTQRWARLHTDHPMPPLWLRQRHCQRARMRKRSRTSGVPGSSRSPRFRGPKSTSMERGRGTTPLTLELKAGRHRIKMVNGALGVTDTQRIKIRAGRRSEVRAKW